MSTKKKTSPSSDGMKQGSLFSFFAKKPKSSSNNPSRTSTAKKSSTTTPAATSVSTSAQKTASTSVNDPVKDTRPSAYSKQITSNEKCNKVKLNMKIAVYWPDDKAYYPGKKQKQSAAKRNQGGSLSSHSIPLPMRFQLSSKGNAKIDQSSIWNMKMERASGSIFDGKNSVSLTMTTTTLMTRKSKRSQPMAHSQGNDPGSRKKATKKNSKWMMRYRMAKNLNTTMKMMTCS
jgi:hypothetical protein